MSRPDFSGKEIRSRFTLLEERLYFACQSFGPLPKEALADLEEYGRTLVMRKRAIPLWGGRMEELTGLIEKLLNAPAGSVALRDSATSAQAAIAAAIQPTPQKNRVLFTNLDFHSTRYLWRAQARRGFEVDELISPDGSEISVEQYLSRLDGRTAVIEASLVSPRSNALQNLIPVIKAARELGAITVVDAYQATGVVPIDVQALGADVVVGGTHKYLGGGGMGLAFMYVRPELAERLEPVYPGWFGNASLMSFGDFYQPAPGARRFQQGSLGIEPIYTSRAGVRLALEFGVEHIRARSLELTARIIQRADALGLPVRTPRKPEARGGGVCLDVPNAAGVVDALEPLGIDVDYRQGAGVRVAPHYCQREDECDRVVDAIAQACRAAPK